MRLITAIIAALLIVSCCAEYAAAQATTVQLPTYSFFTTSTSVMVPDRGATVVGGMRQGSLGSSFYSQPFFGPVRQTTSATAGSQVQVHAQIHDMKEMDEALLAKTGGAPRPPLLGAMNGEASTAKSTVAVSSAALPPAGSVADAKRARQAELAATDREAQGLYEQGQKAEADGRPSLARAYYQMAAAKASESLKQEIARRAAALPRSPTSARTAQKP